MIGTMQTSQVDDRIVAELEYYGFDKWMFSDDDLESLVDLYWQEMSDGVEFDDVDPMLWINDLHER